MSSKIRAISFFATLCGAALVTLGAGAAPEAKMSDLSAECVGAEAPKALATCPGGPSKFEGRKKHSAAFKSAPPPIEAKKRQDDVKPVNPDELKKYAERDTRKTRLQARARALLITEIQGLERLYKNTPQKSADKPQLTRRLAEGYVELESAALRDKIAADIQAQDAKAKKRDAGKFRSDAASAGKIVKAARVNAIKYYTLMKDKFPKYSKIDEVLYYLAYEYEQAQNYDKAREVYLELIDKAPKSPYIPNAYLAFGELFFQEAQGDPSKWELAAAAYKEVIKYPPPTNKVYGYARYKLGYVHWNKGDYPNALSEFKRVIEYGDQYAELPNAKQLAKAARRDVIPVYAVSGAPEKAYNFSQADLGRQERRQHRHHRHDERARYGLPRYRPLPRGHRPLQRPFGPRRRREELLLPGPDHAGHAGALLGRQGDGAKGARSAASRAHRLREGLDFGEVEARVLEQDGRAPRRDRDELAPRGRGLGWRARYGRQEDDGSCRLPLQEGLRELHRGGLHQVPVPAHRQERLADDVQDQVRDGGLALLPAALGGLRAGLRRRGRRKPQGRTGRGSRVRFGALLPEDVRPDVQGGLGPQEQGLCSEGCGREGA